MSRTAATCPACGAPTAEEPPFEAVPGPVSYAQAMPRMLGAPAAVVLLCLAFAALGAAAGLFAAGHWPWGLVLLGAAVLLLAGLAEAARHRPAPQLAVRSAELAAGGREQAASTARVWRARADALLARGRADARLRSLERTRPGLLQELGAAAWRGDEAGEREARRRLDELERGLQEVERERAERLAEAGERIRGARLPVQDTLMVAPTEPSQPYPPPGEGDPPQPAVVPEPYPPPDEGTPPTPAPDPDDPGRRG